MIDLLKKSGGLFLAIILVMNLASVIACAAPEENGTCGKDLTWTFDSGSRTLTISGTGEMDDYDWGESPWFEAGLDCSVQKIVVSDGVTDLGAYAFAGLVNAENVSLPEGLVSIGECAFSECQSLYSPVLPEGLLSIEERAFESCDSIESICLPASLISMGDQVFFWSGLKKIEVAENSESFSAKGNILYNKDKSELVFCVPDKSGKVTVPDSVKTIRRYAFSQCSGLTDIVLPSGLTEIGESAFWGCTGITGMTVPSGISEIKDGVFGYCTEMKSVSLPSDLKKIGEDAFRYCYGLEKITIPEDIERIEAGTFRCCYSLEKIAIPRKVKSIKAGAFWECVSLKKFEVDADNKYYSASGGILYNKKKTKAVAAGGAVKGRLTLPDTVTEIADKAFGKCENITSVYMPSGLSEIGSYAFFDCTGLTKAVMSPKLASIGDCAFDRCYELTTIRMQSDAPALTGEYGMGTNFADSMAVYYPSGASGYKKGLWKNYVCKAYTPETGVTLNKTSLTLYTGGSTTLKAEVKPSDAHFKNVTWKSSNTKIATVSGKGVVKGLIPGKVTVTAVTDNGKKAVCDVTVRLAAPELEKVTSAGYNSVKITWKKVTAASGYYVYRRTADGWKRIGTITDASTLSCKDSGLTCGKSYTYTVKAYRESGDSKIYSSYNKDGISGKPIPGTPSLKSLSQSSGTSLELTWSKVSGAGGYVVYRKTGNGDWKKIKTITKGSTVTYTDTGLKKGKKYTYTVKAYRVVNEKKIYSKYDKKGLAKTVK